MLIIPTTKSLLKNKHDHILSLHYTQDASNSSKKICYCPEDREAIEQSSLLWDQKNQAPEANSKSDTNYMCIGTPGQTSTHIGTMVKSQNSFKLFLNTKNIAYLD